MKHASRLTVIVAMMIACTQHNEPITAETALARYLDNGDDTYGWELVESERGEDVEMHHLLLTSQTWRGQVWKHQLSVIVPDQMQYDGALLFITGGSIEDDGSPRWNTARNDETKMFANVSSTNKAIVAVLRQVPNQPLYDGLVEDQLISFTLHQFREDGDFTWPLLFPMTKGAIRAMDALQEFSTEKLQISVGRFVVSGGSKRGWTTWLTGASDNRVAAIAPMVIDVLNMPVNLEYHLAVWDDYSEQIQDYVRLEIPQEVHTEKGDQITKMVDPYCYREALNMPKLIMIGTNDEYWPVDAIKHYFDDLQGKNYIHYVANAGHDLGGGAQAIVALSAFFGNTLQHLPYPACKWDIATVGDGIELRVEATGDKLLDAILWTVDSEDRDFRDEVWTGDSLQVGGQAAVSVETGYPEVGFRAFYVDLVYEGPHGTPYNKSTRMFVADEDEIFLN